MNSNPSLEALKKQLTQIGDIESPHDLLSRLPIKKQYKGPRFWIKLIQKLGKGQP